MSLTGDYVVPPFVTNDRIFPKPPWVKPFYRENMSHVRRAKDLLLLICNLSLVFQHFGSHHSHSPAENIMDVMSRYDHKISRPGDDYPRFVFRFLAMPCKVMRPCLIRPESESHIRTRRVIPPGSSIRFSSDVPVMEHHADLDSRLNGF